VTEELQEIPSLELEIEIHPRKQHPQNTVYHNVTLFYESSSGIAFLSNGGENQNEKEDGGSARMLVVLTRSY
jgi:hypothetical protein